MIAALLALLSSFQRSDLVGTVSSTAGNRVPGAHVIVYTASYRVGTSPFCPSCYRDCGKRVRTNMDGCFNIQAVDPNLVFRLLVVADGYEPQFLSKIDPLAGPTSVTLVPVDSKEAATRPVLYGQVKAPDGSAVEGATITNFGVYRGSRWRFGGEDGTHPLAITGTDGTFKLAPAQPLGHRYLVLVEARGFARTLRELQVNSGTPVIIRLNRGAKVTGRILHAGKPVPGITVGLVQVDRRATHFTRHEEIGTDVEGRFRFENAQENDDYYVYTTMASSEDVGVGPVKRLRTGAEGATTEVGDLDVVETSRLSGHLVLADGRSAPPKTRVVLSRRTVWDSAIAEVGEDGRFEFGGLPTECYELAVGLPGYRLSIRNPNLEPASLDRLVGVVDGDIDDLTILLEPIDDHISMHSEPQSDALTLPNPAGLANVQNRRFTGVRVRSAP